MIINTKQIIKKVDEEFTNVYRASSKFKNSGKLWDECINTVADADLMNKIIFCNDVLEIPPTKVFLKVTQTLSGGFTDQEKQYIGSFWGFIFKNILGYSKQKDSVPINTKGVKKAACFYAREGDIRVI